MIAKKLLTTIAFAFVLLFSGCAEDDFVGVDGLCPLVLSTVPENGDIDIPLNQVITATFNEKMNPSTITDASFTVSANGALIDGTVSYNGLTATFLPDLALEPDTEYTGTITTMAKDERGNALQEDYVWSFTTLPEYLVVVSSDPIIGGVTTGAGLFLKGTPVTVTAVANTGYTFTNWTVNGVLASNLPTYTLPPLMGDVTLVANYTLVPYEIKLLASPTLGGTPGGAGFYNFGSTATVTANTAIGYNFVNWTENGVIVPGATATYAFTVSGARTLQANFVLKTYTLTVNAVNGTVLKVPQQATYNHGATVVLTPTPAVGYVFTSWTGDATGTNNPLTVTMNSDKVITANFSPLAAAFTLNVTAINGTVSKNPNNPTYNDGDNVVLTASPNSGYEFTSWSGDATGTNNPLTVLMDANKDIEANFSLIATAACTPAVGLGLAGNYAILAEAGISTTGVTSITGNMGISPAEATFITGFGLILPAGGAYSTSSLVTGKIYAPSYAAPTPANLTTAVDNMHTAFTTGNGLAAGVTELMAGNLNGETLTANVYKWGTGLSITNGITLDGGGDDCAMFVFQIAQDLTVADGAIITLANGAHAENIYWLVAGSGAVLGTTVQFQGNILSKTLISMNTGATINGRLLAQTAVTLDANSVVKP